MVANEDVEGTEAPLQVAFGRVAERLGLGLRTAALWTDLRVRYTEAHRSYHTLSHIAECLQHLDGARALARDADLVEIALWAHDVIYDPHRDDNERRSAEWVRRALLDAGVPSAVALRAHALVVATTHAAVPADADAQLLCDIDLAVLGAPEARFAEYESQIRAEYAWVPDTVFRARRAEVISRFLARPTLYSTAHFRDALERDARTNLTRALAVLRGARPPS